MGGNQNKTAGQTLFNNILETRISRVGAGCRVTVLARVVRKQHGARNDGNCA